MLRCYTCREVKEKTEFAKQNSKRGYQYSCRKCSTARTKQWRVDNPERQRKLSKQQAFNTTLTKLNITQEIYDKTLKDQEYKCAICTELFINSKDTHKDHCHLTNEFRGLLCTSCNAGLGMFKDSLFNLNAAINYIQKHGF